MAAIVGLLVLMVYLCTNIAYKFIPDKAKKNVKRMFTRKKDGAAAEDEPGGIKRGRSVVEAGLSFRDTVLDFFFLHGVPTSMMVRISCGMNCASSGFVHADLLLLIAPYGVTIWNGFA